jgi:hypothetical protein
MHMLTFYLLLCQNMVMYKLIINKYENICIGIYWNVVGVLWYSLLKITT